MTFNKSYVWALGGWIVLMGLSSCAEANRKIASRKGFNREIHMQDFFTVEPMEIGESFSGMASYYGPGFHGRKTASGKTYDQNSLTCAHKTLPFGTKLQITLLSNGKTVVVQVEDRGPYMDGRVLDLSVAAAKKIGLIGVGVGEVLATVVE